MLFKRATLTVIFVLCVLLVSNLANAEKNYGSLLLLPIIPDSNIDEDETEKVDAKIAKALKKMGTFKITTVKELRKTKSKKRIRKLLQCMDDVDCIAKRLRRDSFDLVIFAKAELADDNGRSVTFTIYNLNDDEIKRTKTQKYRKNKFKNKRAAKWAKRLIKKPELLVAEEDDDDDEDDDEDDEVVVAKPKKKKVKKVVLPTKKEITAGMKQAYTAYTKKDINNAVSLINKVYQKPCRCNADRDVLQLKSLLEEFKKVLDKATDSFEKHDTKNTVAGLEQLQALDSNLIDEGSKLGVNDTGAYTNEINVMFAKAYMAQARFQLNNFQYLEARDSLSKVLGWDPTNKEAKTELDYIPTKYANALYMRAGITADADPDAAIGFLEQILKLTNPESDIYIKAQEKIEEINEY